MDEATRRQIRALLAAAVGVRLHADHVRDSVLRADVLRVGLRLQLEAKELIRDAESAP